MTKQEVFFGASPDFSPSLGDRLRTSIRRRLTISGAQEAWWERNHKKVEQFQKIESQLSPRDRERIAEKLERQAKKDASYRDWETS